MSAGAGGTPAAGRAGGRREASSLRSLPGRVDVVVAGARCAGASTALLLARAGLRVLVVDPVPVERDPLSTLALMRGGVLQLHRWGLLDALRETGAPPVRTTVFHYGDEEVAVPIEPRDGVDALYAPRRTVLDATLVAAARDAGSRVVHGLAVVDLLRGPDDRVRGVRVADGTGETRPVRADLVVGADGVRSRVARLVGAPVEHRARHAAATIYGFWPDVRPGAYHWHFAPGASAGTIATHAGEACVFSAMPAAAFGTADRSDLDGLHRRTLASASPALAAELRDHPPSGPLRAFPGIPGFLRRGSGPGWALVGDAGSFKDPATAHGITDALRDAELLARAVTSGGPLSRYQEARDAVARPFMEVTDRIASFAWDLQEVRELHLELSRAMGAGVACIRALGPAAVPGERAAHPAVPA